MRQLVTREDYFDTALRILGTDGAGRLKINEMCRALQVTTGSFYGYFGSFDGFVTEFLAYWEQSQTDRIVALSNVPEDPVARIRTMKKLSATLPHAAEAAIRSWAHTNPVVADAQKRVDERRLKAVTELLRPAVRTRAEAHRLAIMAITLLVGLQQWRSPVTTKDFNVVFDELERVVMARLESLARDPAPETDQKIRRSKRSASLP
ncbi:TetR/AcrR family transcriptional regulator [Nocardia niigatensis]|uniref:TetR/AcrR family transcriptional regulator n=1 Tax=Nocardia niigatensis TaxID=209249 RepID=UPI00030CC7AE|nr:TetR/AcrR family transcriptional regulator [Nocardia niigatensis]